jgi:pimeloyl-ACP methyl ester carboxylesterase
MTMPGSTKQPRATRRQLILGSAVIITGTTAQNLLSQPTANAKPGKDSPARVISEVAQSEWQPEPAQAPATEHVFEMADGTKLWGWDTGGTGPAIVLMHAFTGSAATWMYQQPVLAKAGYRVVAFSRRGHYKSDTGSPDRPGRTIDDLAQVLDQLAIKQCHLLGTAAGGFSLFDFAISHPQRVRSLVCASSQAGIDEPSYAEVSRSLLPVGWRDLPVEFKELGPSYRAANPLGVRRWLELERAAQAGNQRIVQAKANSITWAALRRITVPVLVMTGDADLYAPPMQMYRLAEQLPGARFAVLPQAGHAAYWEQPDAFNRQLLRHLARAHERF